MVRVVAVGSSRRLPAVELDVSSVYDFLLSPVIITAEAPEDEQYEATATWQATVRERSGEGILTEMLRLMGSSRMLEHEVLALARLAPDGPKTVTAFLDMVEQRPGEELAVLVLDAVDCGEVDPPDPALVAAALGGDRAAVGQLLSAMRGAPRRRAAQWLADPTGAQADLVTLLRGWYEQVFAPEEARLLPILQRDAAVKARIQETQGAEGLLRAIGGTLQFSFGPHVQRVAVAPCVLGRPAIFFFGHEQHRLQILAYPVADESLEEPEPLAPPRALVRLYKVLCDETRLKILRLLAHDELYATEIAERLGLSKATVSHHMVLLRAAGLVEVRGERKAQLYYALHRPALDEPTALLGQYLKL